MSADLVDRLRAMNGERVTTFTVFEASEVMTAAADEIERLRGVLRQAVHLPLDIDLNAYVMPADHGLDDWEVVAMPIETQR